MFLLPDGVDHIAVVLSLAVVFHVVSESLSPFQNSADMKLYRWGNFIVLASMYVALLIKAKTSDGEFVVFCVFGWVLIASNVVMIVSVVFEAVNLGRVLGDLMPRVQQIDSPVRRPIPAVFTSVRSIHPSPMVDDMELPGAPPETL